MTAYDRVWIAGFSEILPPLQRILDTIRRTRPVQIFTPPVFQPAVESYCLPAPYPEARWVAQKILQDLKAVPQDQISIVTPRGADLLGPLASLLTRLGISPAQALPLPLAQTVEGIRILHHFGHERSGAALPFSDWVAKLKESGMTNGFDNLLRELDFFAATFSPQPLEPHEWHSLLTQIFSDTFATGIPREGFGKVFWGDPAAVAFSEPEVIYIPHCIDGCYPAPNASGFFFTDRRGWNSHAEAMLGPVFPTAHEQWRLEEKQFRQLLASARTRVVLTHPRTDASGRVCSPSLFLKELPAAAAISRAMPPLWFPLTIEEQTNFKRQLKVEQERLLDHLQTMEYHAHIPPTALAGFLKDKIFSASQLESYAACPFQYFANRLLKIPEEKEERPEVDPNDQGTLFHTIMERLVKGADTDQVIDEVFEEFRSQCDYANPYLYQKLREKTRHWIWRWLEHEAGEQTRIEAPLATSRREWIFGETLATALAHPQDPTLLLGGRVDRIDTDADRKRFLVIDYKTGSQVDDKNAMLEGLALQLPLYIVAVQQLLYRDYQPVGGLLVHVQKGNKNKGLVDKQYNKEHFYLRSNVTALMEKPEMDFFLKQALEFVRGYVDAIRGGIFKAQPKDCATYCDYKKICRYPNKPST